MNQSESSPPRIHVPSPQQSTSHVMGTPCLQIPTRLLSSHLGTKLFGSPTPNLLQSALNRKPIKDPWGRVLNIPSIVEIITISWLYRTARRNHVCLLFYKLRISGEKPKSLSVYILQNP